MAPRSLLLVTMLVLAACSSGGGGSDLGDATAKTSASYQVIALDTGTVTSVASVPDLLTDPRYRSSHMVFKLIPKGSSQIGTSGQAFAAQVDDPARSVEMPKYYMAVFEITQAQWQRLAASQPWLDLTWSAGSEPVSATADGLPAYGLSASMVDDALSIWQAQTGTTLRLPTNEQWEYACRAGTTTLYSWGDDRQRTTATRYAATYETGVSDPGPQTTGSREPNGFGLYDMHGNCWELTSTNDMRGGSWFDPVSLARSANRNAIDPDTPHALVGARLIYLP